MELNTLAAGSMIHARPAWRGPVSWERPSAESEFLVDGRALSQTLSDDVSFDSCTVTVPFDHEEIGSRIDDVAYLREVFARRGPHDIVQWTGIAALLGQSDQFPLGKLPLYTCCGDELCGYLAVTVTQSPEAIVWSDFGTVYPEWPEKDEFLLGDRWLFEPIAHPLLLSFAPEQYRTVLREMLTLESQLNDHSSQAYRTPRKVGAFRFRFFAAKRGFEFSHPEKFRLSDALHEADPLGLQSFGDVSYDFYTALEPNFWAYGRKDFASDPARALTYAIERTFRRQVSPAAIDQAVAVFERLGGLGR